MSHAQDDSSAPWKLQYRLPASLQPLHYDLLLHPHLSAGTFSGSVSIDMNSSEPRDYFLVHLKDLQVESTALFMLPADGAPLRQLQIADAFEFAANELWVVKLTASVPAGNFRLSMTFHGSLTSGIVGFYRSVYLDSNGQQHFLATSKFQPTYARRCFPCLDEPSFKSTFSVSLVRPSKGYMALSNMPEASSRADSPQPGLTVVTFEKTPPMVTYLAIFIVCDFDFIERTSEQHKIRMRVFGSSRQKHRLDYALKTATGMVDFYTDFFKVPYPLPKLDMAAIPDYSSGATEHWGLITYREVNLVLEAGNRCSASAQQNVARVIAHELAHQWFGNLVTLSWWNDLWLNEGFATFLQFQAMKAVEPHWDTDASFLLEDLHPVLELDATQNSHPVVMDVSSQHQINAIFDLISYSKAASIIRMMQDFVGPDAFKAGVTAFLTKFAFKNAVTQDLLDQMDECAPKLGVSVTKIMSTWTRQVGYPVLSAVRMGNVFRLTQRRFLCRPSSFDETEKESFKWEIPVTYRLSSDEPQDPVRRAWLHPDQPHLDIPLPGNVSWVKFNVRQVGYYRVNYEDQEWEAFAEHLFSHPEFMNASDRAHLINDAFSLAKAGQLRFDLAFGLIKYLISETELAPWMAAIRQLQDLANLFYFTDVYPHLISYQAKLVTPLVRKLGWSDQGDHQTQLMRVEILDFACRSQVAECVEQAAQHFLAWINGSSVNPDLKPVILRHGMRHIGNKEHWDRVLELYSKETNAHEKYDLLCSLASVGKPWMLEHLIQSAKDGVLVRRQDFMSLLRLVAANRVGEPIVWDFVRREWPYLVDTFTLDDRLMANMIPQVTKNFATTIKLEEMEAFFAKYPDAGTGERARKVALEKVARNMEFVAKHQLEIRTWLQNDNEQRALQPHQVSQVSFSSR